MTGTRYEPKRLAGPELAAFVQVLHTRRKNGAQEVTLPIELVLALASDATAGQARSVRATTRARDSVRKRG